MNIEEYYQKEVAPKLMTEQGYTNALAVPRVLKIVLNIGLKEAIGNKNVLENVSRELAVISGQKPKVTRAKRAIAGFKLRAGDVIGLAVTLRKKKMSNFLEKLIGIVLPRMRDFRGLSRGSFDSSGNYTLGITEQIVFPEIDFAKIDKIRGLEITLVTSAKSKGEAEKLLEYLGMPFQK
ncbi:MAG: 50S ribosomal protein L5 [bacterium]|nr:50S ribosomal protein L5 [bacterium]